MQAGRTPSRIMAVLELEGGWMTAYQLEADLALRWQAVTLGTIRRALHRLIDQHMLESRIMLAPSIQDGGYNKQEMEVRVA